MVVYYSDISKEPKSNYNFSVGTIDWNLSFEHEGFPVGIKGTNEKDVAVVTLGGESSEMYITFPIKIVDKNVNELVVQAKEMLNDYFEDYRNGVN